MSIIEVKEMNGSTVVIPPPVRECCPRDNAPEFYKSRYILQFLPKISSVRLSHLQARL